MNSRKWILGGLLLVLVTVVAIRAPRFHEAWQAHKLNQIQQPISDKGVAAPVVQPPVEPPRLVKAPVLAEGSLNPIEQTQQDLTKEPLDLATDDWRSRYRPIIARVAPAADAPTVGVYPFLDRTPGGVGVQMTRGWREAAEAALEFQTNARVLASRALRDGGFPTLDELVAANPPTDGSWCGRALADPALADARYLVTGVYEPDSGSSEGFHLRILLLDRQNASAGPAVLWEDTVPGPYDVDRLSDQQRRGMRELAARLIEKGALASAPAPEASDLDLDGEMAAIILACNSCDRWTIMDGIDRALWLAKLKPETTLPLQAAAYGIKALDWSAEGTYQTTYNETHGDEVWRGWALTQLARMLDPKPLMNRLNDKIFLAATDYDVLDSLNDPQIAQPLSKLPELLLYRDCAVYNHDRTATEAGRLPYPPWQRILLENRQTTQYGNSELRNWMLAVCANWPHRDALVSEEVRVLYNGFYLGTDFVAKRKAGAVASAATVAGAVAAEVVCAPPAERPGIARAFMDALPPATLFSRDASLRLLLKQEAERTTATTSAAGLSPDDARLYYELRTAGIQAFLSWESANSPDNPCYTWIRLIGRHLPEATPAESGWDGFEWTPRERVRLAQRLTAWGPDRAIDFTANTFGSYDLTRPLVNALLDALPDVPLTQRIDHDVALNYSAEPGEENHLATAARQYYRLHPEATEGPIWIGKLALRDGQPERAAPAFAAARRDSPANPFLDREFGLAYYAYGCNQMAVWHLERFVRQVPTRYDVLMTLKDALGECGLPAPEHYGETIQRATRELPGNPQFHQAWIRWLRFDKKDDAAALAYTRQMMQSFPNDTWPWIWAADIAEKSGDHAKAVAFLRDARVNTSNPVGAAATYGSLAETALDFGDRDLAREFVEKAQSFDSAQQGSLEAATHLALKDGDFKLALQLAEYDISRYGLKSTAIINRAEALAGLGRPADSIAVLENQVAQLPNAGYWSLYVPKLLEYYVQQGDKESASKLIHRLTTAPRRFRTQMVDCIAQYRKLDPDDAAQIEANLDQIMAGPDLRPK